MNKEDLTDSEPDYEWIYDLFLLLVHIYHKISTQHKYFMMKNQL